MLNIFNRLKKWLGYDEVVVMEATKEGNMYDDRSKVKLTKEYRKYYSVNIKNLVWNFKNYIKFKLKLNYQKDHDGNALVKRVHIRRGYINKKTDFAIIRTSLINHAVHNPIKHPGMRAKDK